MQYIEYFVNDSKRKLGVCGENHIYTPQESEFAQKIIDTFDIVAVEEPSNKGCFFVLVGSFFIPLCLAYTAGTNRSPLNATLRTLAEKQGKQVIKFDEDTASLIPLTQKIALVTAGVISIPLSPFLYISLKTYGDPFEEGTNAYKLRINKEKRGNGLLLRSLELLSPLFEFAYTHNMDERNILMAERTAEILRETSGNLLRVCGEMHMDGLIRYLHDNLNLEEISSFSLNPAYFSL